jgi:hypothetical protein
MREYEGEEGEDAQAGDLPVDFFEAQTEAFMP